MTSNRYPHLLSPGRIGTLELKNRIVMGPMGNINLAEEMGRPSTKMIQYFAERARGGAGLLTSGAIHRTMPVSQVILSGSFACVL